MDQKNLGDIDLLVVLGAGMKTPREAREETLDRAAFAASLYQSCPPDTAVLLSGGYTLARGRADESPVSEAAAMARHMQERGVPEEMILLEEQSKDTLGNIYFCLQGFLLPMGFCRPAVVTSAYHTQRTELITTAMWRPRGIQAVMVPMPRRCSSRRLRGEATRIGGLTLLFKLLPPADDTVLSTFMEELHPYYGRTKPALGMKAVLAKALAKDA